MSYIGRCPSIGNTDIPRTADGPGSGDMQGTVALLQECSGIAVVHHDLSCGLKRTGY